MPEPNPGPLAKAIASVLRSRDVPVEAASLSRFLKERGHPVHRATLEKILSGESRPQHRTLEKILDGVRASQVERQMVWAAWERSGDRSHTLATVSVLAALGGAKQVDVGRREETVTWRYFIGATAAEDEVVEIRHTLIGPEPMTLASCGPGQFGTPGYALEDLPTLDFRVRAFRLVNDQPTDRIPTALHVVTIAPERRQQRLAIQFSDTKPGEWIAWELRYRMRDLMAQFAGGR